MPGSVPSPYVEVADDLRARIRAGEWEVGDRLPSRAEIAAHYGVGVNVAQKAQRLLVAEGLVEARAGSGVYVRQVGASPRELLRSTAVGKSDGWLLGPDGTREGESRTSEADDDVARRLRIKPGARVMWSRYELLDADRRPAMLVDSWEPLAITGGSPIVLPEAGPLAGRGVAERMAAIGITVTHVREVVRGKLLGPAEAEILGTATGSAATLIRRTHFDATDRPVETADILVPADRWEIGYELPVGPATAGTRPTPSA